MSTGPNRRAAIAVKRDTRAVHIFLHTGQAGSQKQVLFFLSLKTRKGTPTMIIIISIAIKLVCSADCRLAVEMKFA